MRQALLLSIAVLPLAAACDTYRETAIVPPSLELQTGPVGPESIMDEITPPSDLLSGGVAGSELPPPTEAVGGYRFHDHRTAEAARRFQADIDAAIEACDSEAYSRALNDMLDRTYEAEARERSTLSPTAAYADRPDAREADRVMLDRVYNDHRLFPRPCPPSSLIGAYGRGETRLPTTGIGFQRNPGEDEVFALETAGRFDTQRLTLEWFRHLYMWHLALALEHGWGDASTAGEIPAGTGIITGIVYGRLSPSGSSGVSVGDRGSQNTTDSEFDYWNLKLKAFLSAQSLPDHVRPFVYVDFLRTQTRHRMSYFYDGAGPPPATFRVEQDRDQRVEETYFGGGFGAVLAAPLSERLTAYAIPSVGGFWRRSDLSSREWNRCNFCPMSDRDWVFETQDSDDAFSLTGTLALALEYRFGDRVSLGMGGHVTWLEEVGAVDNPVSGDDVFFDGRQTGLGRDEATTYGWQIGLRYAF